MLCFVLLTVPQFNAAGQATSPVKTDDAWPAPMEFITIKIDKIGRTKQPQ
jgi:hypothetical protein